jgi:hypothetical protein
MQYSFGAIEYNTAPMLIFIYKRSKTMALPIAATPELDEKDLTSFYEAMDKERNRIPSEEDMKDALRIFNNYKEMRQNNPVF